MESSWRNIKRFTALGVLIGSAALAWALSQPGQSEGNAVTPTEVDRERERFAYELEYSRLASIYELLLTNPNFDSSRFTPVFLKRESTLFDSCDLTVQAGLPDPLVFEGQESPYFIEADVPEPGSMSLLVGVYVPEGQERLKMRGCVIDLNSLTDDQIREYSKGLEDAYNKFFEYMKALEKKLEEFENEVQA